MFFVISYQYLPNVTITVRRVLIIVAVVYMFIISRTHIIYTAIRLYHRTRDVFIRTYQLS